MVAKNIEKKNDLVKLEEKSKKFTLQKSKLKKFSKKIPKQEDLPTVDKKGAMFGMIEYKVRQSDLNSLTESIQSRMITTNKHLVKVIKQFEEVYNTIEFLDNEYIKGILASIKAAEEANRKAVAGIKKTNKHTEEIKQLVDHQRLVIQTLKTFKEDIEKIKHIQDVDELYATLKPMPPIMSQLGNDVLAQENKVKQLEKESSTIHSYLTQVTGEVDKLQLAKEKQEQLIDSIQSHQEEEFLHVDKKIDNQYVSLHEEIISATEKTNEEMLLIDSNLNKLETFLLAANSELDKLQLAKEKQEQLIESIQSHQEEQFFQVDKKIDDQSVILHKEIISATDKTNEEIRLINSNLNKLEAFLLEANDENKRAMKDVEIRFEAQMATTNERLVSQKELINELQSSLKTTKLTMFISIFITVVLFVLIFIGVF